MAVLSTITNSEAAIKYIQENSGSLTVADIKKLASQMNVDVAGAKSVLAYSGGLGNGSIFFPAGGSGGMEPLILDLDGNGAHTTKLGWVEGQSSTYFDMDNDGFAERTAWVAAGDGMLVIDKNGNGKIDNQNELFQRFI